MHTAHLLNDAERDALDALRDAASAVDRAVPEPGDPVLTGPGSGLDAPPPDLRAFQHAATKTLARDIRELTRLLLESAVEGTAPAGALGDATDRVRRAGGALEAGGTPRRRGRAGRRAAMEAVEPLLRELAAEHHRVVFAVRDGGGRGADGAFAWKPARPEELDIGLLERLFQRFETAVTGQDLLLLQRRISAWWFERFSSSGGTDPERFGRSVREAEWAFLERSVPGIGGPVVDAFRRQGLDRDLPRRQRKLLRRLQNSFAGAFEVVEHDGDRAVFRDVATGRQHRVREHNRATGYEPGEVGLGRLIPAGKREWLRSPGMAFLGTRDPELLSVIRESMELAEGGGMPPAIAVEGTLLALAGDDVPPRDVAPALTKKLARDLAVRTVELLEEAGLADPATDDELTAAEKRRSGLGRIRLLNLAVDQPTADWLAALHARSRRLK